MQPNLKMKRRVRHAIEHFRMRLEMHACTRSVKNAGRGCENIVVPDNI